MVFQMREHAIILMPLGTSDVPVGLADTIQHCKTCILLELLWEMKKSAPGHLEMALDANLFCDYVLPN